MSPRLRQAAIVIAVVVAGWIAGRYLGMGWSELAAGTVVGAIIAIAATNRRKT